MTRLLTMEAAGLFETRGLERRQPTLASGGGPVPVQWPDLVECASSRGLLIRAMAAAEAGGAFHCSRSPGGMIAI